MLPRHASFIIRAVACVAFVRGSRVPVSLSAGDVTTVDRLRSNNDLSPTTPQPATHNPYPRHTQEVVVVQPCNATRVGEELPVEAFSSQDGVISHETAWRTFISVLVSCLLWLLLAYITAHWVAARQALPIQALHSGRRPSGAARIAAVEQARTPGWTTNLFSCFKDFPGFCFTFWCPCVRWADNVQSLHILDYKSARWIALAASGTAVMSILLWVGVSLMLAVHTHIVGLEDTLLTFIGVSAASGCACVLWLSFGSLFTYYRQESRRKLAIWSADTWEGDFFANCCCWPCAIAQETRHIDFAEKDGYQVSSAPTLMKLHPILGGSKATEA